MALTPKIKSTKKPKIGRPSIYSESIINEICTRLANGESLKFICSGEHMPSMVTVFDWLHKNPEFSNKYVRAREEQAETLADEIVAISDEVSTFVKEKDGFTEVVLDATAVARNRLRIDARKWVAAKLKPKKYGDKVDVNHGSNPESPLTVLLQQISGTSLSPVQDFDKEGD